MKGKPFFFNKIAVKRIRSTCLDYARVEVAADEENAGLRIMG